MADSTFGVYNQNEVIELAHKLKSFDAANSLFFEENKENTLKTIHKVIIEYNWRNDEETDEIIELINQKLDKKYSNSNILQLFERFKFIWREIDYSKFQLINKSFPFWENLSFYLKYSRDLEIVTNPILYQNGIGSLELYDTNNILHFSGKFISNIWEIKPKSFLIKSKNFVYKKESNFIDVLQKLPSKMKITFKWGKLYLKTSLIFSNAVLKISQNDRDNFTIFEWKTFLYEIDRNNIKDIMFEGYSSEPDLDWLKLKLRNNYKIEFEEFNPITKEQADEYDSCFPQHILNNESWWTVAVLVKDLNNFKLHGPIASLNDPDWNLNCLESKWSGLKYFSHELEFPCDFERLTNIISLLPKIWVFTVKVLLNYAQSFI